MTVRELGLAVTTEQRGTILGAVKKRAITKRGLLTDDEFSEIVRQVSSETSASEA